MEFTVKCPNCGARLKGVKSLMGTIVECGHCVKEFRVPTFELPGSATKPKVKEQPAAAGNQNRGFFGRIRKLTEESRSPWIVPGVAVAGALLTISCLVWWIASSGNSAPDASMIDLAALENADEDDLPVAPSAEPSEGETTQAQSPPDAIAAKSSEDDDRPEDKTVAAAAKLPEPPPVADRSRAEMLQYLKNATVFIKVTTTKGQQSGSGFLVEREGNNGFVVSNAHVVEPLEGSLKTIECVFRSGRPDEFRVVASVAGRDSSRDLAILKINHEKLPEPISETTDVEIHETLSVLVLGFPFGEVLTTSKRNPAITVTRCAISSMRRDDYDNVSLLQVDGGINPGNSGGPVVTEEGYLVGVAVAKLIGTEIGFAIPRKHLGSTLAGRVSQIELKEITKDTKQRIYNARPTVVDPRQNIKSVEILTFAASELQDTKPEPDGNWKRIAAESTVTPLEIANGSLVIVPVALNDWAWQVKWTLKDGGTNYTEPVKYGSQPSTDTALNSQPSRPSNPDQPKTDQPKSTTPRTVPEEGAHPPEVVGDIKIVHLPSAMADFAINPVTGDIATVDPESHRAHLFRATAEFSHNAETETVRLGDNPTAITFKRFKDQEVYVAVCSQDANMYVIDANSFELLKKIPVESAGGSRVECSMNPEDPFVYYISARQSSVGVVDLRQMVDRGIAFNDAMTCSISADGHNAYRRRSGSPSGFESMVMLNEFSDEKPYFVRLFYDHRSSGEYIMDPAGAFTASGKAVYAKGLEKHVANLSFAPSCFFESRPVIVGWRDEKLFAASYNTFSSVGKPVELPLSLRADVKTLSSRTNYRSYVKGEQFNIRVIADNQYSRIIFAIRDKIALIPLSEFDLPDEPFMDLKPTITDLIVGQNASITMETRDPRVSMESGDLPEGAVKVESILKWTPGDAHVGNVVIPVTLSFDDIKRVFDFTLHVAQPSVHAPFEIAGMFIDKETERAICWSGAGLDRYGRPLPFNSQVPPLKHRIAVVSLNGDSDDNDSMLAYPIKKAIAAKSYIAVLPAAENSRVEILDGSTLKRIKTLLASEPLVDISNDDNELMLHGSTVVDVYDLSTFKRKRTIGSPTTESSSGITELKDGLLIRGILYDSSGKKPQLLIAPNGFATLKGGNQQLYSGSFLRHRPAVKPATRNRVDSSHSSVSIVAGPVWVPEHGVNVSIEQLINSIRPNGSVHTTMHQTRVNLLVHDSDGALRIRVPLFDETSPYVDDRQIYPRQLLMVGDVAHVVIEDQIIQWSMAGLGTPDTQKKRSVAEFHVEPRQSTFVVEGPTTILKHTVRGGQGPFEYFMPTRLAGVELDETTGDVTISRDNLMVEAATLIKQIAGTSDVGAEIQKLKSATINVMQPTINILGRKPDGVPIAVPIHFKVVDERGNVTEMQYFVLLEVPYRSVTEMLRDQNDEQSNE